jgi:Effector Associated Constant Component 1
MRAQRRTVRIDIIGDGADLSSLMERLRTVPELRVVLWRSAPEFQVGLGADSVGPGDRSDKERERDTWLAEDSDVWNDGETADTLTVLLSTEAMITVLAPALTAYLEAHSGITIRITSDAGRTVTLRGGTTIEEARRTLRPLTFPRESVQHAVGNSNIVHTFRDDVTLSGNFTLNDTSGHLRSGEIDGPTLPITIYLSNGQIHDQVEAAIDELLAAAGLRIRDREEPVIGSWFRRMRAAIKDVMRSPAAREGALVAAHAADTRLVLAQDAAVTATLLQNLGPVIASLQPTKDAVLRVGALLIVKVDWVVNVFQLTAAQQALLDHRPQLATSPHEIIAALNLTAASEGDGPPALQ